VVNKKEKWNDINIDMCTFACMWKAGCYIINSYIGNDPRD